MTRTCASRLFAGRLAMGPALLALSVLLPSLASAQAFDRTAYDARAGECVNALQFAEQALSSGDTPRGLTYVQLAAAPCDDARNMLIDGLQSGDLSERNRQTLSGDLVSQDSRWVILASRLGMCPEAQQRLAETSRLVPSVPQDTMERYVQASQALLTCVPQGTAQPYGVPPVVQPPIPTQPVPTYPTPAAPAGYVTAGPGYGVTTAAGMAGGPVDGSRFGASCRGSISDQPAFQLSVPSPGTVTVQVTSTADTTLVVTGPGGTFCNDDFNGLNPGLSQFMSAGSYQVYVGEYTRTATGSSFTIRFSDEALAPVATTAPPATSGVAPTYGTAYVGAGYAASSLSGVSGGNNQASAQYGATCGGFVASNPDFVVQVASAATVSVNVTATDNGDTTLIVTGPGGTWCNDDFNGLNPGLTQYMSPGQYQVFVGSYYQNEYHNVSLSFSAY